MPQYHSVALLAAPFNTQAEQNFIDTLVTSLRGAGVTVNTESDIPGRKRHSVLREFAQAERVILIATEGALQDGPVLMCLDLVQEREAEAGGESFIIPVTMGVDLQMWVKTHRVPADSPVHPLADLVPLRADGNVQRLVTRLLKALEAG